MDFHILRQQGLSIRKIAVLRGVSRNAVRRALRSSAPPSGKRRRAKGLKLAPFTGLIDGWLRDEVKSQWTAERIFDELEERGYDCGRTVLKEYVRTHRPRPQPIAEARVFVKPSQQMQVDWAELGVVSFAGVPRKLYAFIAIMAWSRELYVHFTTDMKLLTWLDCHRRAFAFFGGVPREVLIDNLKTGVASRAGATVRFHKQYQAMAVAYGFRPIAHFPRRPKPKDASRGSCASRGSGSSSDASLSISSSSTSTPSDGCERANRRVHRITRERPDDRFAVERTSLNKLIDYDIVLEEPRVADSYALVSVDGVRYSIPPHYARRHLTLQRRPENLTFVVDAAIVAQHPYGKPGQRLVQDPAHLPPPGEAAARPLCAARRRRWGALWRARTSLRGRG